MIGTKPKYYPCINQVYNINDFNFEDEEALTASQGKGLFIQKMGDIVNGSLIFNNIQTFNEDIYVHNNDIIVYDANNTAVTTLDNSGNINCKQITCTNFTNGIITNNELNQLYNIQTQINTINTANATQDTNIATSQTKTAAQSYASNTTTFSNDLACQSFTCTSFTNGTVSNTELNQLDNIATNIQTKFNALDTTNTSQDSNISTLQTKTTNQSYSANTTTFSNNLAFTGNLNSISSTIFNYLAGATSNIQTQINSISSNLLASANTWTAENAFNNLVTQTLSWTTFSTSFGTNSFKIQLYMRIHQDIITQHLDKHL